MYLADISACRKYNPLESPMWNKEVSKKLLEGVDFINQDPKARQGLLYHHGKIIAEVNGWTYNDELSKLNSNSGQLRYIFDSSLSFVEHPTAYLSLDMEGPDLAFELCDKRGKHKGECSWDGKMKEPKENHDIKLKKINNCTNHFSSLNVPGITIYHVPVPYQTEVFGINLGDLLI